MHSVQPKLPRRQALSAGLAWLGALAVPSALAQAPAAYADESWQDTRRQRAVPVRIRWPSSAAPPAGWPVVLYSHGLGGSRAGGEVWGRAWAAAGFVVVHLQHAGSDLDAVRSELSKLGGKAALRALGSAQQLLARLEDVVFALDEIARRKTLDKAWRFVRADGAGLAGHSFGAHTTLGVGGQSYPGHPGLREPRIAALIALSPTLPARGDAAQAFAAITRPTLCITGTLDDDVVGNGATADKRSGVFAGNKAMLLLKNADHMTFGGQLEPARSIALRQAVTAELQAQHHGLVAGITTDWWRAYLQGNAVARLSLSMPQGLAAADTWQTG